MFKKIVLTVFLTVILTVTGFIVYKMKTVPEQVVPYPYTFKTPYAPTQTTSSIALMGDRMGKHMAKYLPFLEGAMSKGLASPLKVDDLTANHEGLHRTLAKLKKLTKMPKVIIYHGGSEEFHEKKFETADVKKILYNFSLYEDSGVQTALLFSSKVSHFIYQPINLVTLPPHPLYDNLAYGPSEVVLRQEVEFKLYTQAFTEFVEYIKSHGSVLILVSTPYNLDTLPRKVCESSITPELPAIQQKVAELKAAQDYKSLFSYLVDATKNNPGNAELHFELGQALKKMGRIDDAIPQIELSMAYDCDLWRGGEVYNVIARRIAAKEEIFYFDFSQYIKDQWINGTVFFEDLYPQNVYYERAMENLGSLLKQHLKI